MNRKIEWKPPTLGPYGWRRLECMDHRGFINGKHRFSIQVTKGGRRARLLDMENKGMILTISGDPEDGYADHAENLKDIAETIVSNEKGRPWTWK